MKINWVSILEKTLGKKINQSEIEIFIKGGDYFSHLVNSINQCKGENAFIYIAGWMLDVNFSLLNENEKNNPYPKDSLIYYLKKAVDKRNVKIRVLLWDNIIYYKTNRIAVKRINRLSPNSHAFLDSYTSPTQKATKAIKLFHSMLPPGKFFIEFGNGILQKIFFPNALGENMMPLNQLLKLKNATSHHEKIVIINSDVGLKAYCGGMDLNKNRFSKQHDVQCCVYNSGAHEILERFYKRWMNFHSYYSKSKRKTIPGINYAIKKVWNLKKETPYIKAIGTYTNPKNSKIDIDRSARKVILEVIKNAKTSVYIEDQYMISLTVGLALHKALINGLAQVILLTSHSENSKDLIIQNRKRIELEQTLKYGKVLATKDLSKKSSILNYDKKVRFYQVEKPTVDGLWAQIVHSKLYIIDQEIVIIGSFNFSYRSMNTDSETGVIIVDNTGLLVKQFKKNLFKRYYSFYGPVTESIEKIMENPLDWHKNTNMINYINLNGEDSDVVLNRSMNEYIGIAQENRDALLETPYYPGSGSVGASAVHSYAIKKAVKISDFLLTKKFREALWDIVEAR